MQLSGQIGKPGCVIMQSDIRLHSQFMLCHINLKISVPPKYAILTPGPVDIDIAESLTDC